MSRDRGETRSDLDRLKNETSDLRRESKETSERMEELLPKHAGILIEFSFLAAALCTLWAQATGRSTWLWFFLGGLLAPIALISMLCKGWPPSGYPIVR